MLKRLKGQVQSYKKERQRLLEYAAKQDPDSEAYQSTMDRIDQLDKIIKRSRESVKVIVPAGITAASLAGIYMLQQNLGQLPRAIDSILGRNHHNRHED